MSICLVGVVYPICKLYSWLGKERWRLSNIECHRPSGHRWRDKKGFFLFSSFIFLFFFSLFFSSEKFAVVTNGRPFLEKNASHSPFAVEALVLYWSLLPKCCSRFVI